MKDIKIIDMRVQPGDSAFLIDDSETAILYDSGFGFTGFALAEKLKNYLGRRPLNYIFLTHSHYDHALGSAYVLVSYPEAKVTAGVYAAAPVLSMVLGPIISPIYTAIGADASMFATTILACDMGGYPLAM